MTKMKGKVSRSKAKNTFTTGLDYFTHTDKVVIYTIPTSTSRGEQYFKVLPVHPRPSRPPPPTFPPMNLNYIDLCTIQTQL